MRWRHPACLALTTVLLGFLAQGASALMPWPREGIAEVANGKSAPFVGQWSMQQAGQPTSTYATCDMPFTIRAVDDNHMVWPGPKDAPDAAAVTALEARDGRTIWRPDGDGPGYFSVWVHPDRFHLYDAAVEPDVDWGEPYAFMRCD